jgi:hypothetical protein
MILAKPDSYGKRILICCKDLDINVAGDLLSIKGEKKERRRRRRRRRRRKIRLSFQRELFRIISAEHSTALKSAER